MPEHLPADDLDKLAPTDLQRAAPGWERSRERILTEITTSDAPRDRRWVWPLALAAAVALIAAIALPQVLGRGKPPVAQPATPVASSSSQAPSSSPTTTDPDPVPTGTVGLPASRWMLTPTTRAVTTTTLYENTASRGGTGGIILCFMMATSHPPQCGGPQAVGLTWSMVRAAGITPTTASGVTWVDAKVVGTWDGTRFHVEQVFVAGDTTAPSGPPRPELPSTPGPLCSPGTTPPSRGSAQEGQKVAEQLPDHQASWQADGSLNVLVKTDRAAAEKKIREVYDGPLCVKRGVGPTSTDAERAEKALVARMEGIKELNSIYTFATRDGLWLAVEVVALTPALEQQITEIVGPEVSPYLVWSPQIQPVV